VFVPPRPPRYCGRENDGATRGVGMLPREAFGRVLRALREERALSQERLAELAGVHDTYVSLLERGRSSPTLESIFLLAHGLDLAPSALLARVEREVTALPPPRHR